MAEIEVRGLTKTFGRVAAVRDVSFTAPAGTVTGLLGPNGSGKTTTLRVLLGLVQASAGEALIGGVRYDRLARPRQMVGAMLESTGFHPGRRARDHLRVLADADGIAARRVDEVLELGEVTLTADHVVIVSAGELRFAGPLSEIGDTHGALESAFLTLTS